MFLSTAATVYLAGSAFFYGTESIANEKTKKRELPLVEFNTYSCFSDINSNPITVDFTNIILKKQINVAMVQLSEIGNLSENWNENGASSFSSFLIDKCKKIVSRLTATPQIYPVANGSIQLEYYMTSGALLEFNVFEDKITMFKKSEKMEDGNRIKTSKILDSEDDILKEVDMFYACL